MDEKPDSQIVTQLKKQEQDLKADIKAIQSMIRLFKRKPEMERTIKLFQTIPESETIV